MSVLSLETIEFFAFASGIRLGTKNSKGSTSFGHSSHNVLKRFGRMPIAPECRDFFFGSEIHGRDSDSVDGQNPYTHLRLWTYIHLNTLYDSHVF